MAPKELEQGGVLSLDQAKSAVEARMSEEFDGMLSHAVHPLDSERIQIAKEVALQGGKRYRPYLTMLAFEGYSGCPGLSMITPATALELIHTAMLIHDDVMDQDFTRHGELNVAGMYDQRYRQVIPSDNERRRFSETMAILVGDQLQNRSHKLLNQTPVGPAVLERVRQRVYDMADQVIGGQALDIQAEYRRLGEVSPMEIALHKTASYSLVTPLQVGAELAETDAEEVQKIGRVGSDIGIAFQLRDDILGVFGNPDRTGKSASSDIRQGKFTMLVQTFYERASEAERRRYETIAGNTAATEDEIEEARSLLEKHALSPVQAEIERLSRSARRQLGGLAINPLHKRKLREFARRSTHRSR